MRYIIVFAVALCFIYVNGTVDVLIRKYEKCCGTGIDYEVKHHANFTRINSTATLASGGSELPFDLDDTIMVHFLLEKFMDGEWKILNSFKRKDPCALLNKHGDKFFYDIESSIGLPRGKCPLPKGTVEIKTIVLDFNKLLTGETPKGWYRSLIKAFKGDKEIFCWNIEADAL